MKMKSILNRVSLLILALLLFACGDADQTRHEDATGGGISFNVTWVGAPTLSENLDPQNRALDCEAAGIATVSFEVLDQNDNRLAYKTFSCSAGTGRVDNISPGANRTLIVRGLDAGGDELYRGTAPGITVVLGGVADVGEVVCLPCETWYEDSDADTYGDPLVSRVSCLQPAGYVLDNTDCDDSDVNEHPGQTWYQDVDGDGYSDGTTDTSSCLRPTDYYISSELVAITGDCADTDDSIHPGATENCSDFIDNDCDTLTDCDDSACSGDQACQTCTDADSDTYFAEAGCGTAVDCDDTDANEHPDQTWYADLDADGYSDGTTDTSSCLRPLDYYLASELIAISGDCDDSDINEHPNQTWYLDGDGDGYSDGTTDTSSCLRPVDYYLASELTALSGDCDDSSAAVNPGATDICGDGTDQDCSGSDLVCAGDTSLIAYYPFNGNANDETGHGHNGTVYGATLTDDPFGNTQGAYTFDGVDDYIQISPNVNTDLANSPFTISTWVKVTGIPDFSGTHNAPFLTNDYAGLPNRLLVIDDTAGGVNIGFNSYTALSTAVNIYTPDSTITMNGWHHVAVTLDDSTMTLYVDSIAVDSVPHSYTDIATWDGSLKIGGNERIGRYLEGALDEIRIYNRVLSATEIRLLHEADYTNSFGMTFKAIPHGIFTMGSPDGVLEYPIGSGITPLAESGRDADETPHQVTLTQPFFMMSTEVTQGQWAAVMGSNPSDFTACGRDCPVEQVSWDDIQAFLASLNSLGEGIYRLPTEAEWEYAARAGSTTAFANGAIVETGCNLEPNLDATGWYCYNAGSTTHEVAQKVSNAWGLYDMHGNVYEWCQDWSGDYPTGSVTDPRGPAGGSFRVARGGAWVYGASDSRSAYRSGFVQNDNYFMLGFRLVREYDGTDPYNIGLVAHYPFDGNANDTSGNSNDGVVNGAILTTDRFGNADSAYRFDGTDDWIEVADDDSLDLTTFTAISWHKAELGGAETGHTLVVKGGIGIDTIGNNANYRLAIDEVSDTWRIAGGFEESDGTDHWSFTDYSFSSETWYFVAATYDASKMNLYIDGALYSSIPTNAAPENNSLPLVIGKSVVYDYEYVKGPIDDVRIYNRALTAPEIQSLFRANGPPFTEIEAISTVGATDWERFVIEGETYLALANYYDDTGSFNVDSKIYKWNGSLFVEFQTIPTSGALDWESFTLNGDTYLAVANSSNGTTNLIDSKVYQWNGSVFVEFQSIPTQGGADWEYFSLDGEHYLAIANFQGASYNVDSVIYKWNGTGFVEFQSIATHSGYDWEDFVINGELYLAMANFYDESSWSIDSIVYRWNGSAFVAFQSIPTVGAKDWEAFSIAGVQYLAVANYWNGTTRNIDSKIYQWNGSAFMEIQSIPTIGAQDWESFGIAGDHYLAVSNHYNDVTYNIDSKIYKWHGNAFSEAQAIATIGANNMAAFAIDGETYLGVANFRNETTYLLDSKIYK
jgi:formylglycine-generating enzyme required for sulfatase activity